MRDVTRSYVQRDSILMCAKGLYLAAVQNKPDFLMVLEKRSWKYADPVGTKNRELRDKHDVTYVFSNNLVVQIHCLCHSSSLGDKSIHDSQLYQPVPEEEMRLAMVIRMSIRILQYLF